MDNSKSCRIKEQPNDVMCETIKKRQELRRPQHHVILGMVWHSAVCVMKELGENEETRIKTKFKELTVPFNIHNVCFMVGALEVTQSQCKENQELWRAGIMATMASIKVNSITCGNRIRSGHYKQPRWHQWENEPPGARPSGSFALDAVTVVFLWK